MNGSFLEHVAEDLVRKHGNDLSRMAVVFPNKRAALFFNEYLVRQSERPIWSPTYITISELFRNYSTLTVADEIKLVCLLYQSFAKCTGTSETLDQFFGWGQLLLADFEDIDKNMADACMVFKNLADYHEMDDIPRLEKEQEVALKRFWHNFHEGHQTELKQRFLTLWSKFYDIYVDFIATLRQQGIAYEGMLYKEVVGDEMVAFEKDKYVFVGFNVLHQVEKSLFERLKNQGRALFYWDFDHHYLQKKEYEAGYFIKQYLRQFPNELDSEDPSIYHQIREPKEVTYVSAATENIQARYVSTWLEQQERMDAGRRTAIVLCNESLLPMVIHALPDKVETANVTTGFPLAGAPIFPLVCELLGLQTVGQVKRRGSQRNRFLKEIILHPYAQFISPEIPLLLQEHGTWNAIRKMEGLCQEDEGIALLMTDLYEQDAQSNDRVLDWMGAVLQVIGCHARDAQDPMLQESTFRMYTLLNRLADLVREGTLTVDAITLGRLIRQLVQATTIPFHGEPLAGIQVMGVLETRNLDFDHLLILSCNEGNMPKGVSDVSFLPHSIRKAFGLTTIEHKVAVYAYYFYRLLQRCKDVTITYNNATQDGRMHEMSRFMLQWMVERGEQIKLCHLQASLEPIPVKREPIAKSEAVMDILHQKEKFSPTMLNRYLRCPLQFYYYSILGLKEPENDAEDSIDNRQFGNIFHRVAELIYRQMTQRGTTLQSEDFQPYLKDSRLIYQFVDQAIREELEKIGKAAAQEEYNGLHIINREVVASYTRQLLLLDSRLTPFTIMGLEQKVSHEFSIQAGGELCAIRVEGIVDRLDCVQSADGSRRLRVVDYKTGRAPQTRVASVEEIFEGENVTKKHTDYFLQTMLYALMISREHEAGRDLPVSPALLFIQQSHADGYDPTLSLGNAPILDIRSFDNEFPRHLQTLMEEIFNPQVPFSPTPQHDRCRQCPYRHLCGE